jgi:apolipoprotein D and lipocalin family protein
MPAMIANMFQAVRHAVRRGSAVFNQPPATVAKVDLDRLIGTWFEVARLHTLEADGFGQRCVDVTATYGKRPDGRISVQTVSYNARAGMRRSEVNGTARPADASGSKLVLTFYRLIRGNLWVIGLDSEYRWALMGTPSRRRLWLIARTPRLDPAEHDRAMAIAAAQGYDAARVRPTAQSAAG